jgi:hypothetical protein
VTHSIKRVEFVRKYLARRFAEDGYAKRVMSLEGANISLDMRSASTVAPFTKY